MLSSSKCEMSRSRPGGGRANMLSSAVTGKLSLYACLDVEVDKVVVEEL